MFYQYLIFFSIAFVLAFCITPFANQISQKLGAIDVPKDGRRMHNHLIDRLGGIAIILRFIITIGSRLI